MEAIKQAPLATVPSAGLSRMRQTVNAFNSRVHVAPNAALLSLEHLARGSTTGLLGTTALQRNLLLQAQVVGQVQLSILCFLAEHVQR